MSTVTREETSESALDLARDLAGLADDFFLSADLPYIRATVREWREQARKVLDSAEVQS